MKIIERLAARNSNPRAHRPVLIACLGDSVTHGCFELDIPENRLDQPSCRPWEGYPMKLQRKLSELYPNIPLVVITPFWRGNFDRITKVGSFDYAAEKIIDCAKVNKKLTVVDGKTLIDHDPKFFSPDVLHPNDEGFEMLSERLFPVLEKLL